MGKDLKREGKERHEILEVFFPACPSSVSAPPRRHPLLPHYHRVVIRQKIVNQLHFRVISRQSNAFLLTKTN